MQQHNYYIVRHVLSIFYNILFRSVFTPKNREFPAQKKIKYYFFSLNHYSHQVRFIDSDQFHQQSSQFIELRK